VPVSGPALVVVGTRHPATARQVESAEAAAVRVVRPSPGAHAPDEWGADMVAASLQSGQDVILTTEAVPHGWLQEHEVARRLAAEVTLILDRRRPSALVLTGGDVAASVVRALDARGIWLVDELLPGVPLGQLADGRASEMPVVTKAGGFGNPDAILTMLIRLHGQG
jgi:uncharacterized protein YgbK (DUF1537 family)